MASRRPARNYILRRRRPRSRLPPRLSCCPSQPSRTHPLWSLWSWSWWSRLWLWLYPTSSFQTHSFQQLNARARKRSLSQPRRTNKCHRLTHHNPDHRHPSNSTSVGTEIVLHPRLSICSLVFFPTEGTTWRRAGSSWDPRYQKQCRRMSSKVAIHHVHTSRYGRTVRYGLQMQLTGSGIGMYHHCPDCRVPP